MKMITHAIAVAIFCIMSFGAQAQTTCRKSEQKDCFTFQVIAVERTDALLRDIMSTHPAERAATLGMKLYVGLKDEALRSPQKERGYVLYLWMDDAWGAKPLPGDRIVGMKRGAINDRSTTIPVSWKIKDGPWPTVAEEGPLYGTEAHFALTASGKVAVGWVLPDDVMAHVVMALICPEGPTYYPFRREGKSEGVLHSPEMTNWYREQGWDYVLSAAVW